jgi:hypothetical protein
MTEARLKKLDCNEILHATPALLAIAAMNGKALDGREVRVSRVRPRAERDGLRRKVVALFGVAVSATPAPSYQGGPPRQVEPKREPDAAK